MCVAVLAATAPAFAQSFGSGGSIGGSNFGSGSSMGGSSFGSGSSGSSSSGNFNLGNFSLGNTNTTPTRGSSNSNQVGAMSPIGPSYANGYYYGTLGSLTGTAGPLVSFPGTGSTGTAKFGQAMYTITTTTGVSKPSTSWGMTSVTISKSTAPSYTSSVGVSKAIPYVTQPNFRAPQVTPSQVEASLNTIIASSPRLADSRDTIQVSMDGPVVILRGLVADEEQRQIAADILRISPGVGEVRNELGIRRR
jgi:hypothetical protein